MKSAIFLFVLSVNSNQKFMKRPCYDDGYKPKVFLYRSLSLGEIFKASIA